MVKSHFTTTRILPSLMFFWRFSFQANRLHSLVEGRINWKDFIVMALARTHLKPLADGEKIHPSDILNEGLTGNTYYVIPTANANYAFFKTLYDIVYSDGSNAVANTITAALSRCVSERNDRIVLQPGATYAENVTVSKDNVSIVGANIFA